MFDFFKKKIYYIYKDYEIKKHNLDYVFFEITRRCNMNCLHCGSDCKADYKSQELTTASWLKIVEYFAVKFNKPTIVITGGEPLVHKDFHAITEHIDKVGLRWGMVTNGLLLTKTNLEKLLKNNILSLTLSLDGTEKTHNYLRNSKSAYSKVIKALDLLKDSPVPLKDVVTCVFPDNLNELDDIAKILIKYKIPAWRLFRIFPSGRAKNNADLQLSFEQTQQLLEWIKQKKPYYKKHNLNLNLSCEGFVPFEKDKYLRDLPFFCRSGINVASVLSDGYITGCTNNHESFYVGNIIKDDFADVWENNFGIFRERKWVYDTECVNCEYFNECKGGSIHLWELPDKLPKFCYTKKLTN